MWKAKRVGLLIEWEDAKPMLFARAQRKAQAADMLADNEQCLVPGGSNKNEQRSVTACRALVHWMG